MECISVCNLSVYVYEKERRIKSFINYSIIYKFIFVLSHYKRFEIPLASIE